MIVGPLRVRQDLAQPADARRSRALRPRPEHWLEDAPIVDAISPSGSFDAVTGALAAVGLGSVPAWLRPYRILSNGERFRADLARIICDAPAAIVVDEFTSVVDRQIAKVGALAFQKAWRRNGGRVVLSSPATTTSSNGSSRIGSPARGAPD